MENKKVLTLYSLLFALKLAKLNAIVTYYYFLCISI